MNSSKNPAYNLWTEPWIVLTRRDGSVEHCGIEQALLRCQDFVSIYEQSPLAVAGIHRLLTAITQAIINPQRPSELAKLWQTGEFPAQALADFGNTYALRFDLFSAEAPFMQSADISLQSLKKSETISAAKLFFEVPSASNITHFLHGADEQRCFCPACAATGILVSQMFALAAGRGYGTSINGVPPIYILPGGETLFHSIAASLILPDYQPEVRSTTTDNAAWGRSSVVASKEQNEVGYLHSLTFLSRRLRLQPEEVLQVCSRCGRRSAWGVKQMVYGMGESRQKEAPFWFDPFVAYKLPEQVSKKKEGKTKEETPTPFRPTEGKATWREFGSLFLQPSTSVGKKQQRSRRPSVIEQMAELDLVESLSTYPFRCIGLRTDMKAKVFEWIDATFDVPPALLKNANAASLIYESLRFATECEGIIRTVFRQFFGGTGKHSARHENLRIRMQNAYWSALAIPFRNYILRLASVAQPQSEQTNWLHQVTQAANTLFAETAAQVGDDAANLRQRVKAEQKCHILLFAKRKEYTNE